MALDDDGLAVWGSRLRDRRLRLRLTQSELAARIGTTQAAVSAWESGRRRISDPYRLAVADALGVRPSTLFPYRSSSTEAAS
jgi:transcriptional regulator with XRE-family HTH domain